MIREAMEADIPRIVELGSQSLIDGPYAGQVEDNPTQTAAFALDVISKQGKVIVAEEDGQIIGLFGFILYDHPFTAKKTAYELIWYIMKEYRKSFAAIALLRGAQRVAKEMGAIDMQVSAPNEDVGNAYTLLGYKKLEVLYQKSLIVKIEADCA